MGIEASVGPDPRSSWKQGVIMRLGGELTFHGLVSDAEGRPVGAVLRAGDTCPRCLQPLGANEVVAASFKPEAAGRFGHVDCNDPCQVQETEEL